jgi:MFS superfamily sulfate permease-like transporter
LAKFPESVLGVLLTFAGLGLAVNGAKRRQHTDDSVEVTMTILATAVVTLSLKTLAGCVTGVVVGVFHGQFDHVVEAVKQHKYFARFCLNDRGEGGTDTRAGGSNFGESGEPVPVGNGTIDAGRDDNSMRYRKTAARHAADPVTPPLGVTVASSAEEDDSTAAGDEANMNLAVAGV